MKTRSSLSVLAWAVMGCSTGGLTAVFSQDAAVEVPAAKGDKAANRQMVGDLGSTRRLVFEGKLSFPEEDLRRALGLDVDFVLASHPSAGFAGFPPVIEKELRRGYLHAGFPKTAVRVAYDPSRDGGCLVVRIDEGPRYRMGGIRIEGTREVSADELRKKLLAAPGQADEGSLATVVRTAMAGAVKRLLPPDQEGAAPIPGDEGKPENPPLKEKMAPPTLADSTLSYLHEARGGAAGWSPGNPISFSEDQEEPLHDIIRAHLSEMGHSLAKLHSAHEVRDDGMADLVIRIEDEGPVSVIGRIDVIGCTRNPAAEVLRAAGLASGQPFTPRTLDNATIALWNTGRFFPFTVIPQRRGENAREIDLTLQVRELNEAPLLTDKVAPEQDAVRRFIITLNEWLATGRFTDFQWSRKMEGGGDQVLAVSKREGIIFERTAGNGGEHQLLSVSRKSVDFELTAGGRHSRGSLPGLSAQALGFFNLLPSEANDGKVGFGTGLGISSRRKNSDRLAVDLLISPALPFLKTKNFRRDGAQVVFCENDGPELLRIDIATALPVSGKTTAVEFRDGVVREKQAVLGARIAAADPTGRMKSWLEAGVAFCRFMNEQEDHPAEAKKELVRWLEFASLILTPDSLKPFAGIFEKWSESAAERNGFFIPFDPDSIRPDGGNMNLIVGLGGITLAEMLAPPDSWASKLGRELVFIYGGRTEHTARVFEELLADGTMGPVGCLIASELIGKSDAGTARRFLSKASGQATAAGFQQDWRLLLDSPIGRGGAFTSLLSQLAAIGPQQEAAAADLLEPGQARWMRGMLARLREQPAGEKTADWIAPQMDALWNDFLGASIRRKLEAQLHPSFDPGQVAAVVNGKPVRRILVRAFRETYFQQGILRTPRAEPGRPWTMDPSLALAIRYSLLEQEAVRGGLQLPEARINDVLDRGLPELKDRPDEDWLASIGMTREECGLVCGKSMILNAIVASIAVKEPAEREVVEFYQKYGREGSGSVHLHITTADNGGGKSLAKAARATRLVRQLGAGLDQGLPFLAMSKAAGTNGRAGLRLACESEYKMFNLSPALRDAVEKLKPGESTRPLAAGGNIIVCRLEGRNDGILPPLSEIAKKLSDMIRHREQVRQLSARCAALESTADIVVLADPQPAPADPSVFAELLKADSFGAVGQLGVLWEKALAKEGDATDALQSVIDAGFLDPADLVALADALLALDQKPLAILCVREAVDRNPAATRTAIGEALEQHASKGAKGQQGQLGQLLKPGN